MQALVEVELNWNFNRSRLMLWNSVVNMYFLEVERS